MKGVIVVGKNLPNPQAVENVSSNHFVTLSTHEATYLKQGEKPQLEGLVDVPELNARALEQARVSNSELPREGEPLQHSPIGANVSLSYVDITRKKQVDSLGSSEEYSIEQLYKNVGRKSCKKA